MAVFLLRISFQNHPAGSDLLLAGRIYPLGAAVEVGDWLLFGEMKVSIKEVELSAHEGVILTINQSEVETLRRAGIILTKLYGTEIQIERAALLDA